jgi:hypothetical protein
VAQEFAIMSKAIAANEAEQSQLRNAYEIDGPEKVKVRKLSLGDNLPDVETLSIEQRGEARALANQMAEGYKRKVHYLKKILLSLSETDPYRERFTPEKIDASAREESVLEFLLAHPAEDLTWSDLQETMERSADEAAILWQALKKIARQSIASGEYASHAVMGNQTPLRRAQFSVMLDAFTSGWQPRNAIELSLVETLVQAHISYNYWLGSVAAAAEHSGYAAEAIDSNAKRHEQWNPPRLTSQETIDNAMAMADRFNRLFLRTLRQMRDLRRYSVPLTINSPAQVNIIEGGQQVNAVKLGS